MRNTVYFVGAGLAKSLELPQKPIPVMYDFVSVLADYLSDDVILTFLARLEQMEPYPYEWESPQAKELSKSWPAVGGRYREVTGLQSTTP